MKQKRSRVLATLFTGMFGISAFTFGGGFVIVTLMKKRFVDELHWLEEDEMLDLTAMAQSCPGAIAVNAAVAVGWKMAGIPGVLTAVLATVLPPMIILGIISLAYAAFASNRYIAAVLRGMQAGVSAVVLDVALNLGMKTVKTRSPLHIAVLAAAFVAAFVLKVNVILIVIAAALTGLVNLLLRRRGRA